MSVNGITNVMTPTVECDASGDMGDVTFGCEWATTYNGLEEFKFMDCVFFLNGGQYFSDSGQSDMDSDSFKVARRTFYPITGWKVERVDVKIRGVYASRWGRFASSPTLYIQKPKPPEVEISVVEEGGQDYVKVEVTPDDGDSYREVLYTRITIKVPTASGTSVVKATVKPGDDTPYSWKTPLSSIANLLTSNGVSRVIEASAYSQGLAGDSETAKATRRFAYPNVPVIGNVGITSDLVSVFCDACATAERPVDTIELEIAKAEKTYEQACSSPNDIDWESVKEVGGGSKVIWDTLANAREGLEPGMRVFYRIKSVYDGNVRYSKPYWVESLYQPKMTVTLGSANILSAISGDDGTSVRVDVEWADEAVSNPGGGDISECEFSTELSWAQNEYAWQSTKDPERFRFSWEDSPKNPAATLAHSGRVYISDLEEGVPVYVKARRAQKTGDEETFGGYSNAAMVTPVSAPAWVSLDVPSHVAEGQSIPCTWTLGTDAGQTGWAISCVADPESITGWDDMDEAQRTAALDARAVGIAQGTDAGGYFALSAETLPEGAKHLMLKCSATTGGLYTDSDYESVEIAQAPTCAITANAEVTALPLTVHTAASPGSTVAITVISRGTTYDTPTGYERQFAGDIVWAGTVEAGSDALIDDARLIDGCTYDIRATAADAETGLRSDEAACSVTVRLARSAAYPDAVVTCDSGERSASIVPVAPEDAGDGDVCDIYRVTPSGADLIASGVEFGSTVRDRFAPYTCDAETAETAYRIATRTTDGDRAWMDFPCELHADGTRLDWDDKHVELDFNISIEDERSKGFEARGHMDGSVAGFWEYAVERNLSIKTEVIRFEDAETKRLLNEMAEHPGAVFVRTGAGHALDANIDLKNMSEDCDGGTVTVKLGGRVIDLTAAHMCGAGDVTDPPKQKDGA